MARDVIEPGAQGQAVKDGRADLAVVFEWDASIGVTQFGLEVISSLTAAGFHWCSHSSTVVPPSIRLRWSWAKYPMEAS